MRYEFINIDVNLGLVDASCLRALSQIFASAGASADLKCNMRLIHDLVNVLSSVQDIVSKSANLCRYHRYHQGEAQSPPTQSFAFAFTPPFALLFSLLFSNLLS